VRSLRTGKAQLVAAAGQQVSSWWNTPHLDVLDALAPTSCIVVPLIARGLNLGALLFAVTRESGRRYSVRDLELARDVARRAASAIDHALLYRAAERATRARDELMEVVAHDLKNPLNTIKLSLQRLLEDVIPDDHAHRTERESLGAIVRAAERMHRLSRDLLNLSQVTGGRLLIQPVPTNSVELVREAVEAHLPLAAAKDITLEATADTPLPRVLADPDRIAQVFSNLIDNALKFTPAGGRVTVRGSPARDAVRFLVEDTGPGIPTEHHPHVFDRFWQARNTARMGTGLGLSIARAIVEGHCGTIGVVSAPGEGSCFHFSLPAVRDDANP
jgi:signal transduction histidine kinase